MPTIGAVPVKQASTKPLPPPTEPMTLSAGMSLVSRTPDRWSVVVEHEIGPLLAVLAALPVRDLEIVEPSLEDVLRSFYRVDAS